MRERSLSRRLLRVNFVVGVVMVGFIVGIALLGTVWTPFDPDQLGIGTRLSSPGENGHLLGSDGAGRDVVSLLMVGAGTSVTIAAISSVSALFLGTLFGGIAAVGGGRIDEIVMRSADVMYAFPSVIFAVILAAKLGPGMFTAVIAIIVIFTPTTARLVRGVSMQMLSRDWVMAARAYGRKPVRIFVRQVIPNISATLIVQGALLFAVSILVEAALSYLGLGVQPPTPSWGRMLRDAQDFLSVQSHLALWPGLCIVVTVLGVNLIGDGLRDALDPRGVELPR